MPAAEILAAWEEIDEAKVISYTYSETLQVGVDAYLLGDSSDLLSSLYTEKSSADRSIRRDIASIQFEYQTGRIKKISWIPGKISLANIYTKMESGLIEALLLTIYEGKLHIDFEDYFETKNSKNLG